MHSRGVRRDGEDGPGAVGTRRTHHHEKALGEEVGRPAHRAVDDVTPSIVAELHTEIGQADQVLHRWCHSGRPDRFGPAQARQLGLQGG